LNGCPYCYARKLANGRLKTRYLNASKLPKDKGILADSYPTRDPFYPRFWPERLEKIRAIKKPTGIFLDDMSDWIGDYWPEEQTRQELQLMRDCPQHRFYTLTKQAQNLLKWDFPENCWIGVTATNTKAYIDASEHLANVKATVKYISFEPLLERIDCFRLPPLLHSRISWLIIGACTGTIEDIKIVNYKHRDKGLMPMPYGRKWTLQPPIAWLKEIVEAADKAGVKVFLKDNLKPFLKYPIEYRWAFTENRGFYKLRQEMPSGR
jgi:protein gp37